MALLPITQDGFDLTTDVEFADYPTYTYYVDELSGQIRGFVDGHEAMVQAVKIIFAVDRFQYQIISPNSGMDYADLLGYDFGFICSEIKRRVADAVIPDNRITSVDDFVFTNNGDHMFCEFTVYTVYGPVQSSVTIQL